FAPTDPTPARSLELWVRQPHAAGLPADGVAHGPCRSSRMGNFAAGWGTKQTLTGAGRVRGGRPFTRSSLYRLLTNVTYMGQVRYRNEIHPGEQPSILDPKTWQEVTARDKQIREELLPRLATLPNMPKNAGKHETTPEDIALVQRGLLFNGGVEACDGTIQIHETLPLTIYQIGVSLVSYRGDQGTWGQRLFRRDLHQKGVDVEEMMDFLERRAKRDSSARMPGQDHLGELIQKALLDYAERAILL